MSCSCRAVPWRTFVRGLAQVHRLDGASAVHPALRPVSLGPRGGGGLSWAAAVLRQSRALHATQLRSQDDGAAPRESEERSPIPEVAVGDGSRTPPAREVAAPPSLSSSSSSSSSSSPADSESQTVTSENPREIETRTQADPNRPSRSPNSEKKKKKRQQAAEAAGRPARERTSSPKIEAKHQPYRPASKQARPFRKPNPDFDKSGSPTASSPGPGPGPGGKPRLLETWKVQKAALKAKFPEGWKPRKRLSPDALAGIRALHAQFPEAYTNEALAQKFGVASEAIRRILKTKWTPSAEEEQERQERWFRRGKAVWAQKAALGVKPPKRWRMEGVTRDPGYHEWSKRASRREREWEEEEVRKYREYRESRKREGGESSRGV